MTSTTVTEQEIEAFLTNLRAADVDKKVNLVQQWGLKLEDVSELPERTVDAITLLVSPFLRSTAHLLISSTLTGFLPPFLPLVPSSPAQSHLRLAMTSMLPGLIEKLNDPKDKFHVPARECLALLGGKAYASESLAPHAGPSRAKDKDKDSVVGQWETAVKDALSGRGARGKLEALKLLLQMRSDPATKLPLKPWLASLVNLLEDSDGAVRDQARETVVALLSPPTTPPAAKTEFKKLMLARNVRKSIADVILARVLGGASVPSTPSAGRPGAMGSSASTRAPTPASTNEDVEIAYIASARDLDSEFKAMIPHFNGKETEHNWGPRERAIIRIRGMLRGQVFAKHPDAFLVGLKSGIVDGLTRTLTSLRTTVSQQSCSLVQELAEYLGPAFDPSAELLLPTLGKMAGLTKRMIADKSQKGVTAIIKHSTVHPRVLVSHIGAALGDKSVHTRQHGAAHLRTFLETPAGKSLGGHDASLLEQVEQMLKRCLADINPLVREQGRTTYWAFERLFPQPAAAIMAALDPTARRQLEKANATHRPGEEAAPTPAAKPATPKPRASSAMSAMIAAKRAKAAAERANAEAGVAAAAPPSLPTPTSPAPLRASTPPPASPPEAPRAQEPHAEGGDDPQASPSPLPLLLPSAPAQHVVVHDAPGHEGPRTPTKLPRPVSSRTSQPSPPHGPPHALSSPASTSPTVSKQSSAQKRVARLSHEYKPATTDDARSHDTRLSARSSQGRNSLPSHNGNASPASRLSALPRPISAVISGASSDHSGRSRSSSLARTLSRSPPGPAESPLQALRAPPGAAAPMYRRTASAPLHLSRGSATPRSIAPPRPRPSHSSSHQQPLIAEHSYFAPQNPAEEARQAQALQGLSAANQLLEFDDDTAPIATVPMTPMRAFRGDHLAVAPLRTPMNGFGQRHDWEDSPKPMTPRLLDNLQRSGYERSWWTVRNKLLEEAAVGSGANIDIEAAVAAMAQPNVESLQQIASFSSANPVSAEGQEQHGKREVWERDRLFDRVLDSVLATLDPSQSAAILEQALVTLFKLVENQWAMFESREDSLLDRLLLLRTIANHTVLESTNAMISLLVEVCDPPFLLLLLESTLERLLETQATAEAPAPESARIRTAAYTYALTAMAMCILKLPKEAVEGEAKRRSHLVVQSLDHELAVSSRQAGNRVILAVQCVLQDDARTLALFPGLTSTQRDFATYQMSQTGVFAKVAEGDEVERRELLHGQLKDGLAKGSLVR